MKHAIFISYRRDDAEGEAGRLYDDLVRAYGNDSVFMDVAGIAPGLDFRKAIDDNVSGCGVFLAIIGSQWATITGADGKRRLDDDNDFVRLEIASALARNIAVIPVLVHESRMPRPDQLPDNIKDLAFRNSVEISHARWNSDVQLLIAALKQYVTTSTATETQPVHATVPVQLPPPVSPYPPPDAKKSRLPLIVGISVAALVVIAAVVFFVLHSRSGTDNPMAGTWTNPASVERNGLNKLEITGTSGQLAIHAWGQCQPADCDWGTQTVPNGQKATATWNFMRDTSGQDKGRVATVTVAPDNGKLNVTVVNTYTGRPGNQKQFEFVRAQ